MRGDRTLRGYNRILDPKRLSRKIRYCAVMTGDWTLGCCEGRLDLVRWWGRVWSWPVNEGRPEPNRLLGGTMCYYNWRIPHHQH